MFRCADIEAHYIAVRQQLATEQAAHSQALAELQQKLQDEKKMRASFADELAVAQNQVRASSAATSAHSCVYACSVDRSQDGARGHGEGAGFAVGRNREGEGEPRQAKAG